MTGERLTAAAGRVGESGASRGIGTALIGGTLVAYVCAGYLVYALFSAVL